MSKNHTRSTLLFCSIFALTGVACAEPSAEKSLSDMTPEELAYELEIFEQMVEDGSIETQVLDTLSDKASATVFPVSEQRLRLRHASTGKCIYGNPAEDGKIHNWSCWNDPNMVYRVFTFGSTGQYRFLIHEATGKYIEGSSVNGAALTNKSGSNPYVSVAFQIEDAGGGAVRLRSLSTGKCIYGSNTNGGTVHSWSCWNDPNMAYYLDPV